MSCGNCEDCRHWLLDGILLHRYGRGACTLTESKDSLTVRESLANAVADLKCGDAILVTANTFGCVQFEPK